MRCLTLYQPWASLIALGDKKIETRSWQTSYRGPLAIHAAKKLVIPEDPVFDIFLHKRGLSFRHLPLGAVVAICRLSEIRRITYDDIPDYPESEFGDYTPDRYAWILTDISPLPWPAPARGHRGIWNWNGEQ